MNIEQLSVFIMIQLGMNLFIHSVNKVVAVSFNNWFNNEFRVVKKSNYFLITTNPIEANRKLFVEARKFCKRGIRNVKS